VTDPAQVRRDYRNDRNGGPRRCDDPSVIPRPTPRASDAPADAPDAAPNAGATPRLAARSARPDRRRITLALLLGIVALATLYAWDDSRQPASGSNWVLLGSIRVIGSPRSVRVIRDQADLARAFDEFRIVADPTRVDLARSIVIWFADYGAQGCPARLDAVAIDVPRRLVTGQFSRGFTLGCDTRAVPDSFLVLIDRSLLPPAPYSFVLSDPLDPGATPPSTIVP
jgi:hypothetical protein